MSEGRGEKKWRGGQNVGGTVLRKKDEKNVADETPTDPMMEPASDGPGLEPQLQAQIGRKLKAMYDSYLNDPIPDRLVSLLEQLDEMPSARDKQVRDGGDS